MQSREIRQIIAARPATDGAGVKIMRLTGYAQSLKMDPFLMLDEIRSGDKDDFIAVRMPFPFTVSRIVANVDSTVPVFRQFGESSRCSSGISHFRRAIREKVQLRDLLTNGDSGSLWHR